MNVKLAVLAQKGTEDTRRSPRQRRSAFLWISALATSLLLAEALAGLLLAAPVRADALVLVNSHSAPSSSPTRAAA